jgi:hypothetical protein
MRVLNTSQGYQIKLVDTKVEQGNSNTIDSTLKRKRVIFAKRRQFPVQRTALID